MASIAETGDMVGGLLHEGNSGNAAQADQWIPGLVQRIRQTTGAQPYLKRPTGRPPQQLREWCHEFYYKAESWEQYRRIVLVVSERPDDLFLHHFFLATSLDSKDWHGHEVLSLYCKRIRAGACARCVSKS